MTISRYMGLDQDSRDALRRLASLWRESPTRPAISGQDAIAWHRLVEAWVHDRRIPLLLRRPRLGRGQEIPHASGRILVPTDDSPAIYLLSRAIERRVPSVGEMLDALIGGRFPVAATLPDEERRNARYTGTLEDMDAPNLTELGFSVRHIAQVGLRRVPLSERTEIELVAHSLLFLSPVNMFVVPKEFAGLSGLPEFIEEMDDARAFAFNAGSQRGPAASAAPVAMR